jgi:hypothetical protein
MAPIAEKKQIPDGFVFIVEFFIVELTNPQFQRHLIKIGFPAESFLFILFLSAVRKKILNCSYYYLYKVPFHFIS